jgi:hypothetical protein
MLKGISTTKRNKGLFAVAIMIIVIATNVYAEEGIKAVQNDPDRLEAKSMEEVIEWAEEQNKIMPDVEYTVNGKTVSKEEYITYTEKQYEAERKKFEEIKRKGKKVIRNGYVVYIMPDGSEHSFGEGGAESIESYIDRTNKAKAGVMHDIKNLRPMQETTIWNENREIIEHEEAIKQIKTKKKAKQQKPLGLDVEGFWSKEEIKEEKEIPQGQQVEETEEQIKILISK